jgi:hypothetical protein
VDAEGFIDFALLPEISAKTIHYQLFVELIQVPRDLEESTSFVDERLGLANIMYGAQRQANVLARPVIIPVQPGGFRGPIATPEEGAGPNQGSSAPHCRDGSPRFAAAAQDSGKQKL